MNAPAHSGVKFSRAYIARDRASSRPNYGKNWTLEEFRRMRGLVMLGATLEQLCEQLGRPADGIWIKLIRGAGHLSNCKSVLVQAAPFSEEFFYPTGVNFIKHTPPEHMKTAMSKKDKEIPVKAMKTPIIEVKTLINGIESSEVGDDQIYQWIADAEAQIESLSRIKAKPKSLIAKIEQLQADIDKLVAFADKRTSDLTTPAA